MDRDYSLSNGMTIQYRTDWDLRDFDEFYYLKTADNAKVKLSKEQFFELLLKYGSELDMRWYVKSDHTFGDAIAKFHKDFPEEYPTTTKCTKWGNSSIPCVVYEDRRMAEIDWKVLREARLKMEREKAFEALAVAEIKLQEFENGKF